MRTIRHFVCLLALAALLPRTGASQTAVNFADPNLEAAVRAALGKTNGPLTTLDMSSVTNLLSWTAITNLSGLEHATNLQSLSLYYGRPTSVVPLAGLAHLNVLVVENARALDYAGLSALIALTNLDLYAGTLTNLSWLPGLTNLSRLDLSWNRISDPAPLAALPRLRYLDLSGNALGSCAALAAFTNITGNLFLDYASITNVAGLVGLTNLSELTLYHNQVNELAPLSNLTSLNSLDLGYNLASDYSAFAGLTNLQSLYVAGNSISNISCLPVLPRLASLDVNYNRLDNLNALLGSTNLQWLNAGFNRLTNIAALTNLNRLKTTYLPVNLLNTNSGSADMDIIQALQGIGVAVAFAPQNGPPFISLPDHLIVPANEPTSLRFSISDDLTPGDHLRVAIHSSDTGLMVASTNQSPSATFATSSQVVQATMGLAGIDRPEIPPWSSYLTLTPISNQTGTATITVAATDDTGFPANLAIAVTVIEPVSFDGQAVGSLSSNVIWRTFGSSPWAGQTNETHLGGTAAQSGSRESWLEANLNGPGTLTFWWKTGSSNSFGMGGGLQARCATTGLSGSVGVTSPDWQKEMLSIPDGIWTVRWQSFAGPAENAPPLWLADVNFDPGPPVCWLEPMSLIESLGYFGLSLHGPPGEFYDVEASSDLRQWSKVRRVLLANFQLWFADTNTPAEARFYRLSKAVIAPMQLEMPPFDLNQMPRLALHSEPGQPVSIEHSSDLVTWDTLVQTNNLSGTLEILDTTATNSAFRFYRAKALPWTTGTGKVAPLQPSLATRRRHFPPMPIIPLPLINL